MKRIKIALIGIAMALVLGGCNEDSSSSSSTDASFSSNDSSESQSDELNSSSEAEESKNGEKGDMSAQAQGANITDKFIGIDFGGASYGDVYDCRDVLVAIHYDHTITVEYEDEILGITTLSKEQYMNIEEAADYDLLKNLDLKGDGDVCDGSSYYINFFNQDGSVSKIGCYEPTNEEFLDRYSTIIQNIPTTWINEVRDQLIDRQMQDGGNLDAFYEVIENPGKGYYISPDASINNEGEYYWYQDKTSSKNNIIDEEEWLSNNGFADCRVQTQEGYFLEDSGYYIFRGGAEKYYPEVLEFNTEEMDYVGTVDLSKFINADIATIDGWPFCPRGIKGVKLEDDGKTLYVSISHNTYASFNSENAYIVAIDMDTMQVIWKSENLVSNAHNFAIVGDTIFCGYGFTDEDDYLYALNRFTGEVMDKVKLKTGPSFIYEKEGTLYVRTYDTDYEFTLVKK